MYIPGGLNSARAGDALSVIVIKGVMVGFILYHLMSDQANYSVYSRVLQERIKKTKVSKQKTDKYI